MEWPDFGLKMKHTFEFELTDEDYRAFKMGSCKYLEFMGSQKNEAKLVRSGFKSNLLIFVVAGLCGVTVINLYFYVADFLMGPEPIGKMLALSVAASFICGAVLTFILMRFVEERAYKKLFGALIGSRVYLSLDESGWDVNGVASRGRTNWSENRHFVSVWEDYLLLISPRMICFVPQRATEMPVAELNARITQNAQRYV